jgi:CDP-diacylglycerol---glycerol-3-phosphate 3-phosphatidyltransferase
MSEVETPEVTKTPWSLEMFLRKTLKGVIDPVANFLLKLGVTPNMITALGFLLSGVTAFFAATGHFTVAGILLVVGGPLDVVDGTMARMIGKPSAYGAFIDSVTDRYSELVVLGGLLYYYAVNQNTVACLLVFLAAAGSVLVSYIKSRAESVGYTAKVGILSRVERIIVLAPCLVFNIPIVAMWILAIGANFTAIQRLLFVRKQAFPKA